MEVTPRHPCFNAASTQGTESCTRTLTFGQQLQVQAQQHQRLPGACKLTTEDGSSQLQWQARQTLDCRTSLRWTSSSAR